jgi:trehalose 6-phosphate phosphatase
MRERTLREFIKAFKDQPERSALFLDFDGTISEIAPTPEGASVHPDAGRELVRLERVYPLFFISGRPAEELKRLISIATATYIGLHGLEWIRGRKRDCFAEAEPFRVTIQAAKKYLQDRGIQLINGVVLEDKGLVLAIHYRRAPHMEDKLVELSEEVANRWHLSLHRGRKVIELRPPLAFHKGYALRTMIKGSSITRAIHMGDDLTDCYAFRALHELEGKEFSGLAVAVLSPEAPRELLAESDYQVDGVRGAIQFLSSL